MATSVIPKDHLTPEQRRDVEILESWKKAATEYGLWSAVAEDALRLLIQGSTTDVAQAITWAGMDWDL